MSQRLTKEDVPILNNHIKGRLATSVIGEFQIKQQWANTTHLLEGWRSKHCKIQLQIKMQNNRDFSFIASVKKKKKTLPLLWETVYHFLIKLNIVLLYNLAITLLSIYPAYWKMYVHTKSIHECLLQLYSSLKKK